MYRPSSPNRDHHCVTPVGKHPIGLGAIPTTAGDPAGHHGETIGATKAGVTTGGLGEIVGATTGVIAAGVTTGGLGAADGTTAGEATSGTKATAMVTAGGDPGEMDRVTPVEISISASFSAARRIFTDEAEATAMDMVTA